MEAAAIAFFSTVGNSSQFLTNRIAAGCVPQMLYRTKVLNCNPLLDENMKNFDFLRELD